MTLKIYNQHIEELSKMGCVRYWIWHIMLFKFWLYVTNNFLIKSLEFFQSIWVRSSRRWASFDIFYKKYVDNINRKLGINLEPITKSVQDIKPTDTWTYWIWVINWHSITKYVWDWIFSKDEVDEFMLKWGVGHHICWDGSKWGYLINSNWSKPFKCKLETLKYMASRWMIWYNVRTVEPVDDRTKAILKLTRYMMIAETQWRLDKFLKKNKDYKYIDKCKELFWYWRD